MQPLLSQPQVYRLTESNQVALSYARVLFSKLEASVGKRITQELSDGSLTEQDLLQAEGAIPLDAVESLHSDVGSDELTLRYTETGSQTPVTAKLTFYDKSVKQQFMDDIQAANEQEFTLETKQNTVRDSILGPLKGLAYVIIFGGGFSWLAYYMENADEYSFRVPAVLYPVVLAMEYVGFLPVVGIVALIALFQVLRLIRNTFKPTSRLILTRRDVLSANNSVGA